MLSADPHTQNWTFNEVILNVQSLPTLPSDTVRRASMAHEIGHVFGLLHNTNTNSIMCQYGAGRTATTPNVLDRVSIINKY